MATASGPKRTPGDFLKQVLGRPVVVRLNDGTDLTGNLACLDAKMNIALEQAEEIKNGKVVDKFAELFIRGNNVLYVSAAANKRRQVSGVA